MPLLVSDIGSVPPIKKSQFMPVPSIYAKYCTHTEVIGMMKEDGKRKEDSIESLFFGALALAGEIRPASELWDGIDAE